MVSKRCTYGLRAVLYLAAQTDRGYVPVREISEALGISYAFLAKVLNRLTEQDVLISLRGPNGGVCLAHPADHIRLREVVDALGGTSVFTTGLLGLQAEDFPASSTWYQRWQAAQTDLFDSLAETTLADVVGTAEPRQTTRSSKLKTKDSLFPKPDSRPNQPQL